MALLPAPRGLPAAEPHPVLPACGMALLPAVACLHAPCWQAHSACVACCPACVCSCLLSASDALLPAYTCAAIVAGPAYTRTIQDMQI
jgi:hypothetical protein